MNAAQQPDPSQQESITKSKSHWSGAATAGAIVLSLASFGEFVRSFAVGAEREPARATQPLSEQNLAAIQARVSRIALTPEGQKWMDYEKALARNTLAGSGAPRLIDGTTFLSQDSRTSLKDFVGKVSDDGKVKFVALDENGYKYAFRRGAGESQETWYVSESAWYYDQFPTGIPFAETSLEIWKAGSEKLVQKEFHSYEVFSRGNINFTRLGQLMDTAEQDRKNELLDVARVREFKLGKEQIGYIGLVDGNESDPIMAGGIEDTKYFPQLLNSLKGSDGAPLYNLVASNESDCVVVKSSPIDLLRSHVKNMHDQGVRSFFLNLVGHGNEFGVYFTSGSRSFRLSAEELRAVFTEYKDSNFIAYSIACSQGGLPKALRSYQDPSGKENRILLIVQSKPYSYNQEGRILGESGVNGAPRVHSSYYQIFHAYYLMQGLEFGEAHRQADMAAKKYIPCDAESWLSSGAGGRRTAKPPEDGK